LDTTKKIRKWRQRREQTRGKKYQQKLDNDEESTAFMTPLTYSIT